jgi:hypothetical protein
MAEDGKKPMEPPPESAGSGQNDSSRKEKGNRGHFQKPVANVFEGRCDELKGYVYDCASMAKAADMYLSRIQVLSSSGKRD